MDKSDYIHTVENISWIKVISFFFELNHKFISFDVESLFTNVPISKTINIILKRIYDDKLISTNLRKRTLKKRILNTCTKTAFTFNNKLYEQRDGVSMGSSLGQYWQT